jgi:hypothetical protein
MLGDNAPRGAALEVVGTGDHSAARSIIGIYLETTLWKKLD